MQVKCMKVNLSPHGISLDQVSHQISRSGSTELAACRDRADFMLGITDEYVSVSSMHNPTFRNGNVNPQGQAGAVFLLGGRRSISLWLRNQGNRPEIRNQVPTANLYVTFLRKKRLFDKNLTLVMLSPWEAPPLRDNWAGSQSVDVKTQPEASRGNGGAALAAVAPPRLADLLDRMFYGEN